MNPKQRAAEAALQYVRNDSVIGLGTGSTADYFLEALSQALRQGRLRSVRGVPSSARSEQRARQLGIPLSDLQTSPQLDVTVDGADEVTPKLDLIKGLGGALLREKIVAQNSRQLVILIDSSKRVDVLGEKGPLPVEVATFGHEAQERFLRALGGVPKLRMKDDKSEPFVTDNGNYIYDCKFPAIPDPDVLDLALSRRAGVIESGLFLGMASLVLVGDDRGVTTLTR
jgi:ribose 5-phosphate isomerase A